MPLLLAKLVPIRDWIYLGLFIAFVSWIAYERHHLISEGEALKTAEVEKVSRTAERAADAKVAALTVQHIKDTIAIQETYDKQHQINLDQLASDAVRLREYDAYRRANRGVSSPGSGPGAAPAGDGSGSSDDGRFSSLEQVALGLATAGRDTLNSLTTCMHERDSLTGK